MSRYPMTFVLVLFALLVTTAILADDEKPTPEESATVEKIKVIKPEDATAHATKKVVVEFKVLGANQVKDRNGKDIAFLNSMKDYKKDGNFTVVMFSDAIRKFQEGEEIKDVARHFKNKTVQVTGSIELRRGKPQIVLKKPNRSKSSKRRKRRVRTMQRRRPDRSLAIVRQILSRFGAILRMLIVWDARLEGG